jgi:hypothetical protein
VGRLRDKMFFSEKKNQKTFYTDKSGESPRFLLIIDKSLFASFSPEKEGLR